MVFAIGSLLLSAPAALAGEQVIFSRFAGASAELEKLAKLSPVDNSVEDMEFGTEQLQNFSRLLTYNPVPVTVAEIPILSSQANDLLVQSPTEPNLADPPSVEPASQPNPSAEQLAPEPPETNDSPESTPAQPAQPESPTAAPTAAPTDTSQSNDQSFWERSYFSGDDWRSKLRDKGVTFDLELTQFYQGLAAGTGDKNFDYGGRLDALINLDTGKLGLWKGGGFHTHLEYRFGWLPAFQDGMLLPVHTGGLLPIGSPDTVVASSLYFSQNFGDRVSLLIGKINAVDLLAGDLFFGGWGTQRFMNIAFMAPPSGVVPPTIMGAIANIKTKPVSFTLMVFDPTDRTSTYWPDDLFSKGVNFSLGATHVGTIAGRTTTYGLTATYSTKEGTDLNDVLLASNLQVNSTKKGSYNIAFQFTHLLHQNPANPREGWGVFLKAAIADGNPNPIQNSIVLGLGGKELIPKRYQDSFGLGFYFYNFSDALQDAVDPLVNFGDEYGMEMYYSYAVTPWFYLTGDLQFIRPANEDSDPAVVLGLRARIRF